MTAVIPMPAANYDRISSEHQHYPIENQSIAIEADATLHGFEVVQTYPDSARSNRLLTQSYDAVGLLTGVISGGTNYVSIPSP
jgi:hypothetical protein